MINHIPVLWMVIGFIATTAIGFLMKVLFDWIKNNSDVKKIYMCPIDKDGTTKAIGSISKTVDTILNNLKEYVAELRRGIAVAEKNNDRYTDLASTMIEVKTMIKGQNELQRRMLDQMEKQTEILQHIRRNGGSNRGTL